MFGGRTLENPRSNEENNLWPQHKKVYMITDPLEPEMCAAMSNGKLLQRDAGCALLGSYYMGLALKKLCEGYTHKLQVSSTKSMTGHLLGAAGGIETIFCAMTLKDGIIPPSINIDQLDPEVDLPIVANHALRGKYEYALNNSFGFGGTNSSLLLRKS